MAQLFKGDYVFTGKHKDMVFKLAKDRGQKRKDGINVFDRVIDLYIMAPIFGVIYGRKADKDAGEKSTIAYAQIENEKTKLTYVYRLVMIFANRDIDPKEAVDLGFKYDYDEKKTDENLKLFDQYVLGGLEYIYEYFYEDGELSDSNVRQKMYSLMESLD